MYFRLILTVKELIACLLEMNGKTTTFSSRLLSPSQNGAAQPHGQLPFRTEGSWHPISHTELHYFKCKHPVLIHSSLPHVTFCLGPQKVLHSLWIFKFTSVPDWYANCTYQILVCLLPCHTYGNSVLLISYMADIYLMYATLVRALLKINWTGIKLLLLLLLFYY